MLSEFQQWHAVIKAFDWIDETSILNQQESVLVFINFAAVIIMIVLSYVYLCRNFEIKRKKRGI